MASINGYSIKQVSGSTVLIGPGEAVATNGQIIQNPNDIAIDVYADAEGTIGSNALIAIYVIEENGIVTGKASNSFDGIAIGAGAKQRRIGAVRVTANGTLAEAYQSSSHRIRPTKYLEPKVDSSFAIPGSQDWGIMAFADYATKGSTVEVAIKTDSPTDSVTIKGADGTTAIITGAGILSVVTSPKGQSEYTASGNATISVLGFEDIV